MAATASSSKARPSVPPQPHRRRLAACRRRYPACRLRCGSWACLRVHALCTTCCRSTTGTATARSSMTSSAGGLPEQEDSSALTSCVPLAAGWLARGAGLPATCRASAAPCPLVPVPGCCHAQQPPTDPYPCTPHHCLAGTCSQRSGACGRLLMPLTKTATAS